MLLLHFFQKNTDLSLLCNRILKNYLFAFKYSLILKNNPDWFTQNSTGSILETVLLDFIDASYDNSSIKKILTPLIDAVQPKCISDKVFKKIMNYPDLSTRELLITCMAHKKLTEVQLIHLCNTGSEFECFFELSLLYYKDDNYSFNQFVEFIDKFKNSTFGYMYNELLDELLHCELFSEEKQEWVRNQKTGDGLREPS